VDNRPFLFSELQARCSCQLMFGGKESGGKFTAGGKAVGANAFATSSAAFTVSSEPIVVVFISRCHPLVSELNRS
jgi:hypothetical protein